MPRFAPLVVSAGVAGLLLVAWGCGGGATKAAVNGSRAHDGGAPVVSDGGLSVQWLRAPDEGMFYHGVFASGPRADEQTDASAQMLDDYENAVGRKVAYVYFDDEWRHSRTFPTGTADWIHARGAVPFIRLMMRSQSEPAVTDPVFTLDRILAGEFDGDLSAWADAAKQFGAPLIVEYGTEINGDWNPWSAPYNGGFDVGPDKFRRAYRHIVTLMRGRGADNITWALHYYSQNFPEDPRNIPASYYPGDDVVDWVGISVYGTERSNDHRCLSFRSLVDTSVPQLQTAAPGRPLFIFEFGASAGNPNCAQAPWVQAAFADLMGGRWSDIRGFSWWQQARFTDDPSVGGFTDYAVQDSPDVAASFRSVLTGASAGKVLDHPVFR